VIVARKSKKHGTRYQVRIWREGVWVTAGTYPDRKQAKVAEGKALTAGPKSAMTCRQYVDRYLEEYRKTRKASSYDTARSSLERFKRDFGRRPLTGIRRIEAKDWAAKVPQSVVPPVVALFNAAIEDELLDRNPFRGLGRKGKGRMGLDPPTPKQIEQLDQACSALENYAPMMRALFRFARYTGLRPGEIFALTWGDIDLEGMRVHVNRRLYRGTTDVPKSNRTRVVALPPPARDAILGLTRGEYVFRNKSGGRMSQPALSLYWREVRIKAGLDFDFYHACRHYCAWFMLSPEGLNLPRAVVKEQMGHLDEKLLDLYGHEDVGALERIDRAYRDNVVPLRVVK
jgi:integrase